MSTAIVVPDSFNAPVAAAFAGQQAADDLSGGITGGYGLLKFRGKVWTIQYQGNSNILMRDDGDGPRGSVEVVIVKANANLSKTWYENGWDEGSNAPPDCASANGIVPDSGVPKKQSNVCATCPRNAWGSAPNGGKGKACGDHRRMAIVPLTDLKNEHFGGPLLLRCPAASLQDLAAFNSRYTQLGYPYFSMGIKVSFDPAESFPKFQFAAIRPLTEAEAQIVVALRDDPATARVVNEGSASLPAAAPAAAAFIEPIPAQAVKPQVTHAQSGAVPNVQQAAGIGQPRPAVAGGFGPVAAPAPAPAVQQQSAPAPAQPVVAPQPAAAPAAVVTPAQPVRPAQQMTGFGPSAAETAAPVQPAAAPAPAPAAAAPVTPAVVTQFEGSIDDRLNALVNGAI